MREIIQTRMLQEQYDNTERQHQMIHRRGNNMEAQGQLSMAQLVHL